MHQMPEQYERRVYVLDGEARVRKEARDFDFRRMVPLRRGFAHTDDAAGRPGVGDHSLVVAIPDRRAALETPNPHAPAPHPYQRLDRPD